MLGGADERCISRLTRDQTLFLSRCMDREDCELDELRLSIADDGCGMSAELTGERETFGMLGIRERVHMLGGRILIDSAPGRGTHIEVSTPKSEQPIR